MSYPGKGYMAWGLAGLLSMLGYPLGQHIMMEVVTQYQTQTPSNPQRNHDCYSPPQKRLQEPQATGSYGQLLGRHISQI